MPRHTQRELDAAARTVKLEDVQRQVDDGSLHIRTMTPAERAFWAPPAGAADGSKRPRRRRGKGVSR